MIVEFRTYTLNPGTTPEFEKRFSEALANRTKLSPLAAFWHTEVGPLNQVIHVWPYEDLAARTRVREEATKLSGWPPNTREFVVHQKSQIFIPAPFSPKLEPRELGGVYEIRLYTLKPGAVPNQIDRWSTQIGERTKLSPLAFAGHSELGDLNIWCHIWAYKDANHRAEIRDKARREGIWPPKGGQPGQILKQENMLVVPASFSPLR
ncbi:MAG: NIPSNAP family protein [Alphaproteobacteria bacterium]|nr:NIPSNAP family protein [Alphaproteobacteria bacterium]MBV9587706.1 NIPSNAP family protein [Alphaproteobacteria bacterium]MBV9967009.1 NIPSNAP family protein [Alphaproteobacteria bacterium]